MPPAIEPSDSNWEACVQALAATSKDVAIFGGQAVNFWALWYLKRCPELVPFAPFVSKDLDGLIVDPGFLDEIQKQGVLFRSSSPADGQLAIFRPHGTRGVEVDLFTMVLGFSPSQSRRLLEASIPIECGVRVLRPLDQLIAKAHNLATLPQGRRQDGRHLEILAIVSHEFLLDGLAEVESGEGSARGMLSEIKRFIKLARGKSVRKTVEPLLPRIIPRARMMKSSEPKIREFATETLKGLW